MTAYLNRSASLLGLAVLLLAGGCRTSVPKDALTLAPESMERRQLQTRRFDSRDEKKIVSACAGLLQDLGFNIDEGESSLGLIVASKERSAVETGQVIGSLLVAALTGTATPVDKDQRMRACVVTKPHGPSNQSVLVRVTFQRVVWNTQGQVTKAEGIFDEDIYAEFFEKLSKAIFLEAHQI